MALIEKRGKTYRVRVRKAGHPEATKSFSRRALAEQWARATEAAIERGELVDLAAQRRVTFEEIALRYKSEVSPQKRTARGEGYRIDRLIDHFGKFALTAIRPLDVAAFRDRRAAPELDEAGKVLREGVSGQTVVHDLNTLSAIIEHARKEWGVRLPENPVRAIRKPAKGEGRDRRLSDLELEFLRLAADQSPAHGLRAIIDLAIETSCRLGELIGLEWSRVNLKARTLHLVDTKNGESRTVALSSAAVAALKSLPSRIGGRVFFNWSGSDAFQPTWRKCVARARALYETETVRVGGKPTTDFLADLRFHDLRHEATSRLFERGLNPFEVASMTGHKSMQMLRRYTHVEAAKLAQKLG